MSQFGLIVVGAHHGFWLENEVNKSKGNIILIEPVKYNFDQFVACSTAITMLLTTDVIRALSSPSAITRIKFSVPDFLSSASIFRINSC